MASEYGRVQDSRFVSNFELLHYHEWEQGAGACAVHGMEFSFLKSPCLHFEWRCASKIG